MSELDNRIRAAAYHLWERNGRPEGREAEHWQEAERMIRAETIAAQTPPAKRPAKVRVASPKTEVAAPAAPAKPTRAKKAAPPEKAAAPVKRGRKST